MTHIGKLRKDLNSAPERAKRAGGTRPERTALSIADDIRDAERTVSSRTVPALVALGLGGRFLFRHADAIIAADVLGLKLRFTRTHRSRSMKAGLSTRTRQPHGRYAIPTVELTAVESLKELSVLSGYPVIDLNSSAPPVSQPQTANVVSIALIRQALKVRRRACL